MGSDINRVISRIAMVLHKVIVGQRNLLALQLFHKILLTNHDVNCAGKVVMKSGKNGILRPRSYTIFSTRYSVSDHEYTVNDNTQR